MRQRLTVSVIIPTFNRDTYARQAVESVLAQSRVPDEILLVDDGSDETDGSSLDDFGPPVTVIRQPHRGRSAARNNGLRRARGDLLSLLDSDDQLTPDSIALRAEYLEQHPEIGVAYGDVVTTNSAGQVYGHFRSRSDYPSGMVFGRLARNNLLPPSAFMFRRECLRTAGFFDEDLHLLEDFDFILRLAASHCFAYIDRPVAYYRLHPGNTIGGSTREVIQAAIEIQQRAFAMPAFERLGRREKAGIYCSHGTKHARLGDVRTATRLYLQAAATDPLYPRSYVLLALNLLLGQRRFPPA